MLARRRYIWNKNDGTLFQSPILMSPTPQKQHQNHSSSSLSSWFRYNDFPDLLSDTDIMCVLSDQPLNIYHERLTALHRDRPAPWERCAADWDCKHTNGRQGSKRCRIISDTDKVIIENWKQTESDARVSSRVQCPVFSSTSDQWLWCWTFQESSVELWRTAGQQVS